MIRWLLLLLLNSQSVYAEYRVFLIRMTGPDNKLIKEFPSTLDPLQYRYYYHVPQTVELSYVLTWLCPGNTSWLKPHCEAPPQKPETPPTSQEPVPRENL